MARKVVASIQECFERITDPRVDRGRNHNLLEMIFVTICAVVCGVAVHSVTVDMDEKW